MKKRDKVVVVYGSGASYASGYEVTIKEEKPGTYFDQNQRIAPPTDQKFFREINDDYLKEEYQALWNFKDVYFASKVGLGMEEVWTAVDLNHKHITLDTYSWSRETREYKSTTARYPHMDVDSIRGPFASGGGLSMSPYYTKYKFLGDCGRDFRRLIYNVYADYEMLGEQDCYKCLHELLENGNVELIGYITFNYDCYLEHSLGNRQFKYITDNCDTKSVEMLLNGGVPIVKLHGSLNWEERFEDTPLGVTYHAPPYSQDKQKEPNYQDDRHWYQPAIIPPTIFKQEINDDSRIGNRLTETILQQWRAAITILENADKIIFVGYSFPVSDFHSKRIFQISNMRRMRNNKEAMKILYCVGCKTEEDEKRDLLGNIFGNNADIKIEEDFNNLPRSEELQKFLSTP